MDRDNIKNSVKQRNKFTMTFNKIGEAKTAYPSKILSADMLLNHDYSILVMIYITMQYHIKTVVLRIQNEKDETRSYFLPEVYAEKMRTTFDN